MKRMLLAIGLALVYGCATTGDETNQNVPIVSPTTIHSGKQDADAPAFPTWFVPWYKDKD